MQFTPSFAALVLQWVQVWFLGNSTDATKIFYIFRIFFSGCFVIAFESSAHCKQFVLIQHAFRDFQTIHSRKIAQTCKYSDKEKKRKKKLKLTTHSCVHMVNFRFISTAKIGNHCFVILMQNVCQHFMVELLIFPMVLASRWAIYSDYIQRNSKVSKQCNKMPMLTFIN